MCDTPPVMCDAGAGDAPPRLVLAVRKEKEEQRQTERFEMEKKQHADACQLHALQVARFTEKSSSKSSTPKPRTPDGNEDRTVILQEIRDCLNLRKDFDKLGDSEMVAIMDSDVVLLKQRLQLHPSVRGTCVSPQ
jgi:hypothetical protein